jgi:hypothetical protein
MDDAFSGGLICIAGFLVSWAASRGMSGARRGAATAAAVLLIVVGGVGGSGVDGRAALPWFASLSVGCGILVGALRAWSLDAAAATAREYGLEPGPDGTLGRDGPALLRLESGDNVAMLSIEARCVAVGRAVLSRRGRIALPLRATFWSAAEPVPGWDGWTLYNGEGEPFRFLPKPPDAPRILSLIDGNLRASWQGKRYTFDEERVGACRAAFTQLLAALGGPGPAV